jgi:pyrroline-5-carboxylate reductase
MVRSERDNPAEMTTTTATETWGFLGAGKMATALAQGLLHAGLVQPSRLFASDPSEASRRDFRAATGVPAEAVGTSNLDLLRRCRVLVLAVKPQALMPVLTEIGAATTTDHLVISVVAGVDLDTLESHLGPDGRLVRVMPNTPALVGAGASAYCPGPNATDRDIDTVRAALEAVGRAVRVPENLLDAVTGLSGSGPAYVYVMIEAMADGGVRMGLPRDVALTLAAQTVLGSARMVLETGLHPGLLKDQVASPGGTTIAGLHALERGGLRAAMIDAVRASALRSIELAQAARGANSD